MKDGPDEKRDYCWTDEGVLRWFRDRLGARSMLDIGCGNGEQVLLARSLGYDALGVDWQSYPHTVRHDFTRGRYDPGRDFDLGWSVEFLEHIPERFQPNYLPAFRRCRWLVVTASGFAADDHYTLRHPGYWIALFEREGFEFDAWVHSAVLEHSTMKPCYDDRVLTFLNLTGIVMRRDDVEPFAPQKEAPYPPKGKEA